MINKKRSMEFTTAAAAIDYIHSLPHLHSTAGLQYIRYALQRCANPQDKIKTVHVTGTNGKGSVCYYLTNLLKNSGFKVGTFASPYVQRFNERIQINGTPISDSDLIQITNQVAALVDLIQEEKPDFYLVEFEFLTVMMFCFFAQEQVDFGIIEVGIGGEHDKTNVITPELAIITNVGMDHAQLIGPTLADIAQEKAGVIKTQRPVIVGPLSTTILPIVLQQARQKQAPVWLYQKDFHVQNIKLHNMESITFDWVDSQIKIDNLQIKTFATIQVVDAALALQAYLLLCPSINSKSIIKKSLAVANLAGRLQVLSNDPPIILDGAHNLPAIKALIASIKTIRQQRRIVVLYAAMVDKDRTAILHDLQEFADEVIVTTLDEKRAAKENDYTDLLINEHFVQPWPVAFAQAVTSLDSESMLVICGSLHFASVILELLQSRQN